MADLNNHLYVGGGVLAALLYYGVGRKVLPKIDLKAQAAAIALVGVLQAIVISQTPNKNKDRMQWGMFFFSFGAIDLGSYLGKVPRKVALFALIAFGGTHACIGYLLGRPDTDEIDYILTHWDPSLERNYASFIRLDNEESWRAVFDRLSDTQDKLILLKRADKTDGQLEFFDFLINHVDSKDMRRISYLIDAKEDWLHYLQMKLALKIKDAQWADNMLSTINHPIRYCYALGYYARKTGKVPGSSKDPIDLDALKGYGGHRLHEVAGASEFFEGICDCVLVKTTGSTLVKGHNDPKRLQGILEVAKHFPPCNGFTFALLCELFGKHREEAGMWFLRKYPNENIVEWLKHYAFNN